MNIAITQFDTVLIKIMQILAMASLPYILQGSKLLIGDHLLQIHQLNDSKDIRLILDGTNVTFAELLTWIDKQSEVRV